MMMSCLGHDALKYELTNSETVCEGVQTSHGKAEALSHNVHVLTC